MVSLQEWLEPGAQTVWSELGLSPARYAFLCVGFTLRQTFSTCVPRKVLGLCLPYSDQSWWKES